VKLSNQLNTNDFLESVIRIKDLQRSNSASEFGKDTYFYIRNYCANYHQIIERDTRHHFNSQPGRNGDLEQGLVADSSLRIIFLFRENKHSFDVLLVVCFSVLIIIKLDFIHTLLKYFKRNGYDVARPIVVM